MDIMLLDRNFEICGIVDRYSSLQWIRRYFEVGEFELALSEEYFGMIKSARYVYNTGNDETAIIEDISYETNENGEAGLTVKGRMLEALLYDREINGTKVLGGNLETALRTLVRDNAMLGDRRIERLTLGGNSGFPYTVNYQINGKNLMEVLYEILRPYGMSYRLYYDYLNDTITYKLYKGIDRSSEQNENTRAVFSSSYGNIRSLSYWRRDAEEKNYVTVAGCGVGAERVIVIINNVPDQGPRRELYVDARDLQKVIYDELGNPTTISDEDYNNMLIKRGKEKLENYRVREILEAEVEDTLHPLYRTEYDLGDLCDISDDATGLESRMRITEIREIREGGCLRIEAVFGEQHQLDFQKIWRKEL